MSLSDERKKRTKRRKRDLCQNKSGSPLLCPFLFVGRRWWIQSCQPPVSHGDSQESPEAENVWLTDSKSHCCSASDSDWRQWVCARALLKSLSPTDSLRSHYQCASVVRLPIRWIQTCNHTPRRTQLGCHRSAFSAIKISQTSVTSSKLLILWIEALLICTAV